MGHAFFIGIFENRKHFTGSDYTFAIDTTEYGYGLLCCSVGGPVTSIGWLHSGGSTGGGCTLTILTGT